MIASFCGFRSKKNLSSWAKLSQNCWTTCRKIKLNWKYFLLINDDWKTIKLLLIVNHYHYQASRPQKAIGSRRTSQPSVNYCWTCQFNSRERECTRFTSKTLYHELVFLIIMSGLLFFVFLAQNIRIRCVHFLSSIELHCNERPYKSCIMTTARLELGMRTRKWVVINML